MRESLANIIEKFSVYVESCDLEPDVKETMLWVASEAFKTGYTIGVQKSYIAAEEKAEEIKQALGIGGDKYPKDTDLDPEFVGMWITCDTMEIKVKESLLNLMKEELH